MTSSPSSSSRPGPLDPEPLDAHAIGRATGRGVRVLVVDTGVEADHPLLAGGPPMQRFHLRDLGDGFGLDVRPDPEGDPCGHGTAMASVIRRLAPAATIDSLRALDAGVSSERVLAALLWAIDRRYDVVNCSFGTTDGVFLRRYKECVDRAFCANVLLVCACSNSGHTLPHYPANFPTALATDHGPLPDLTLQRRRGQLVEFVTRGVDVRVAWRGGTTRTLTGTSVAAAHLTGLIARVRELRPAWNACEVKSALYAACLAHAPLPVA